MKYEDKIRYFRSSLQHYLSSAVSNCEYVFDNENKIEDFDTDDGFSMLFRLDENKFERIIFFRKNMTTYEKEFIRKFIYTFSPFFIKDTTAFFIDHIARHCVFYAVATSLSSDKNAGSGYLFLSTFSEWASQTYEGSPICHSIGFSHSNGDEDSFCTDVFKEDFFKVLTSGHDTILVCDGDSRPIAYEPLFEPHDVERLISPVHFNSLASWSLDNDFAIALNRNGEILCFKNGSLAFAYRRGLWIGFSHEAYIKGMSEDGGCDSDLCRALYLTMLDVSFRRTGGCLGLLPSSRKEEYAELIGKQDRFTEDSGSDKSRFLKAILKKYERFQDIPRKLRQELVGIDGATIVDERGELLCVGAILHIQGGSTGGGGRTAAAKAIAKYGLGIKISNDGKIQYWKEGETGDEEPVYTIG